MALSNNMHGVVDKKDGEEDIASEDLNRQLSIDHFI